MFNKSNKIQKQETIEITAHDKKLAFSVFHNTIVALEEYVEKIGYVGFKKQVFDKSINSPDRSPEDLAEDFLIQLYCLKAMVNKKPSFLRDEIKEKFYKWIDATGINANNCSDKLKNYLFEINDILEGGGERFVKQTENNLDNGKSTPKDALNVFSAFQNPINKNREQRELLKGKTHKDVKIENKFDDADSEKGKNTLGQISQEVALKQDGFNFYSQSTSSDGVGTLDKIVQDIKNNPQNWKLDKIPTEIDNFGREKKQEIVLIRRGARLNDFNQEGKLNFNNNPIYKWNSFKVQQKFEMKNTLSENRIYLNKSYLTDDEIGFVIKELADKPGVWRIEPMQGHEYLIHGSAKGNNNREIGTLIHEKGKFSNQEWVEINEVLELNKQHGIVVRKLKGEISPEYGETREGLEIWAKELEKKLLINNIRKNADEWEVRKEIVVLDFNEGEVLARKTAKIDREEDYDLTGGLINKSNEFYQKDFFDDKELAEINSIFTAYKICEKTKQNKNDWMIATVGHNEIILDKKTALINDRGKISFNADGEHYKKENFSDKEWKMMRDSLYGSQNQQQSVNELTINGSQKDNEGISVGGIFAIIGVVSALLIASGVVIRKRLSRKVKSR